MTMAAQWNNWGRVVFCKASFRKRGKILSVEALSGLTDSFLSFCLQNPVQPTVDGQQQQQQQQPSQQQPLIGPQVLLQVQEDLRKLLEQRQAEEEKIRKELEGKVHALQRDSDKYRTELEHAQKEAENYRGRLEVERKENSRLHQLYEAAAKQPAASDSAEDRNSSTSKPNDDTLI